MIPKEVNESIMQNDIITVDYEPQIAAELLRHSDGDVVDRDRGVHEFWGRLDGDEWRVHVRLQQS